MGQEKMNTNCEHSQLSSLSPNMNIVIPVDITQVAVPIRGHAVHTTHTFNTLCGHTASVFMSNE